MSAPAETRDVFEYLKKCASEMRTVGYKEIADRLLRSLEPEGSDPDFEEAWKAEIERRLAALDEGRTTLLTWEEVRDRLRNKSRGQRP